MHGKGYAVLARKSIDGTTYLLGVVGTLCALKAGILREGEVVEVIGVVYEGLVAHRLAVVIDKDISLADLKGTLELFAKKMLGENTKVRFRPSFFPFTEPSVEVDVTCFKCGGKGCSLCKQTGWIEVLGAGMVHPNVLEMNGYDPKVWTGFAFGTGLDRFAMFRYEIPDISTYSIRRAPQGVWEG